MVRPRLQKIEYPAQRELHLATPTTDTPAPNFYSLDYDSRSWVTQGKNFSMYKHDRSYYEPQKPASASDFYNTDQSSKMSLSHKVQRSPYRYVTMRSHSAGRSHDKAYLGTFIGTPERVGPGLYDENLRVGLSMPRVSPGSSSFASGMVRGASPNQQFAEPGYSTLATDSRVWNKHANAIVKGYTFQQTQRWQRAPSTAVVKMPQPTTAAVPPRRACRSWRHGARRRSA